VRPHTPGDETVRQVGADIRNGAARLLRSAQGNFGCTSMSVPHKGGNMKQFATVAVISLFAGFLFTQGELAAQTETRTTTTTTTNYDGTLVDAACQTTHTEHDTSTTSAPDENTTRTETTHTTTESTQCPVTTTTTTFGLITPSGQYVRFDEPSNTKIVEVVKTNKKWHKYITGREPLQVRVVGRPEGDTVVLESIH
jgi:hypothetical protein